MTLSSGTRLGAYEITGAIDAVQVGWSGGCGPTDHVGPYRTASGCDAFVGPTYSVGPFCVPSYVREGRPSRRNG